jgi:ribonuclease HI
MTAAKFSTIHLYTDGGIRPDPSMPLGTGYGGTGFVAVCDDTGDTLFENSVFYPQQTTNQRMELQAAIDGLSVVRDHYRVRSVILFSDSAYLVNCFGKNWWFNWMTKTGWKNSSGKDVENIGLWRALISMTNHAADHYASKLGPIGPRTLARLRAEDAIVLAQSLGGLNVVFCKVKGHSGDVMNERADELATIGKNGGAA